MHLFLPQELVDVVAATVAVAEDSNAGGTLIWKLV